MSFHVTNTYPFVKMIKTYFYVENIDVKDAPLVAFTKTFQKGVQNYRQGQSITQSLP